MRRQRGGREDPVRLRGGAEYDAVAVIRTVLDGKLAMCQIRPNDITGLCEATHILENFTHARNTAKSASLTLERISILEETCKIENQM